MGYYIDLEKVTIDAYRIKLESAYLPPSRRVLKDQLEERFGYFKSIGIDNVQALVQVLKKKDRLEELSNVPCLNADYLKILLREINSTLPKPNKIADFSGIPEDAVMKLEEIGIKNTVKLYDKVLTLSDRQKLAHQTGIGDADILKLTKLTDLSRIKWVGVAFAQMLYALEVDTVEKASKSDPVELHTRINQLNKEKGFYKASIGLNDIRIFVDAAKETPIEVEY
ncbi:DUF4332 domain-containing protein [Labilibacter marinus]|uniref:DUF4332 domain-containing protein n=1 Tax=Labilibacter marinus TaxID=1477105 RepID=UPI001301735C|nr:DUF4332 domain-containing protein [Labilibacter marinus]